MRKALFGLAAVGMVVLVGCQRESPPGGPGAPAVDAPRNDARPAPGTPAAPGTQADPARPAPGAPATRPAPAARQDRPDAEDQTFRLQVPENTSVRRGEREEVTISLDRGDAFDQKVTLQFKTPAGLKIHPENVAIERGRDEAKILIEATGKAVVGEQSITVTGQPETGQATSVKLPVDVQEEN